MTMMGWMVLGWMGLGVPRLESVPPQTTVQMGYVSGMGSYLQIERTTLWTTGNHALQFSLGMTQVGSRAQLYLRGRWDYVRPGVQFSVVGQIPVYRTLLPAGLP